MARTRAFDTDAALRISAELFCRKGFEGTSVDDLVTATGVQRGSLYGAFGSKLGLFRTVLAAEPQEQPTTVALDLLLVALLELAHRDEQVRSLCAARIRQHPRPAVLLGDRLLERAFLETSVRQPLSADPSGSTEGEQP